MRFTILDLPFVVLLVLPFVIAYNGHGLFGTIFWMLLWAAGRQAIVIANIKSRKVDKRIILNTMPVSHFSEKVRWCLDKSGIQYVEEKDIGIFWAIMAGRNVPTLRVPGKNISISNSSDILRYLYGHVLGIETEKAKFMEPSPKSSEWEAKLDQMGLDLRTFAYYHLLVANKNFEELSLKLWGLHDTEIPPWQKTILKLACPLLRKFLIKVLSITSEGCESGLKAGETVFKDVEDALKGGQKYILGTDEPTYIDYTFASLGSLLICPDQYCGPTLGPETRPRLQDLTLEAQKIIKKYRNTNAGKHVLKLYAEHR